MDNPLTLKEKNCRIGDCPTFVLAHNDGSTVRVDGEQIMEGSCRFDLPGWETPPAGQLRYVNRTYLDGIPVRLEVFSYDSPGNLYVGLLSPENDNGTSWGSFTDVTVNMRPLPPYYAFVKEYSENEGMGEFSPGTASPAAPMSYPISRTDSSRCTPTCSTGNGSRCSRRTLFPITRKALWKNDTDYHGSKAGK